MFHYVIDSLLRLCCAYEWPLGVLYILLQYSGGHSEPVPCGIAGPGGEACGIYGTSSCVAVAAIEYITPWCPLTTLGGAAAATW